MGIVQKIKDEGDDIKVQRVLLENDVKIAKNDIRYTKVGLG